MTFKFASLTLLAACTAAASAQTTHPATSATHKTTASTTASATKKSNIPHVAGIPKTLFSLKYIDIQAGTGPLAKERQFYTVRYTGWLTDGTKFDSSYDHTNGEPITFPYGAHRVIIGWDTGFQGMHVGGKRRLFVPYQLAYGEAGRPPVIPAKADLIFDVELVAQSDTPPAPKEPTPPASTPNPQATPQSVPQTKPSGTAPDTTGKPAPEPGANPAPSTPAPQSRATPHPQGL